MKHLIIATTPLQSKIAQHIEGPVSYTHLTLPTTF